MNQLKLFRNLAIILVTVFSFSSQAFTGMIGYITSGEFAAFTPGGACGYILKSKNECSAGGATGCVLVVAGPCNAMTKGTDIDESGAVKDILYADYKKLLLNAGSSVLDNLPNPASLLRVPKNTTVSHPLLFNNIYGSEVVEAGYSLPLVSGTAGQILKVAATGSVTFQDDFGGGDVDGPTAASDTAVVRFSGTTGKLVKNSGVFINNLNDISGVVNFTSSGYIDTVGPLQLGGDDLLLAGHRGRIILRDEQTTASGNQNFITLSAPVDASASYSIILPTAGPANGQILVSDAAGLLTWMDRTLPSSYHFESCLITSAGAKDVTLAASVCAWNTPTKNAGTGSYTLAMTGFPTKPVCIVSANNPAYIDYNCVIDNSKPYTNATVSVKCLDNNQQNSLVDNAFGISCSDGSVGGSGGSTTIPNCTGSQRLTGDGATLSCEDNTYIEPSTFDIDWTQAHSFYKEIAIAGPATFTFSGMHDGMMIVLAVKNISGGDVNVTLPAGKWIRGIPVVVVGSGTVTFYNISRIKNENYIVITEELR